VLVADPNGRPRREVAIFGDFDSWRDGKRLGSRLKH
jgi:hypothetical protein